MLTSREWSYTWNGENRMAAAQTDTVKVEFSYDYMGRCFRRMEYIYDGAGWHLERSVDLVYDEYKQIAEYVNGEVHQQYVWDAAGLDTVALMTKNSLTYMYWTDGNKNVLRLFDAAGTKASYSYEPFGKVAAVEGVLAADNPFRFSSEYHNDTTGLVEYIYRKYDPLLGRWLSRDPIEEEGGENLYLYLMNDVISSFDSLGLANVCCDNADLKWPLSWLRHCEIAEGKCPAGRSWVSYPIEIDESSERRMDNGLKCSCVNEHDVQECLARYPYSAGNGTWGNNCQTSVIRTLANCCLKTTWKPNAYAGNPRGKCLEYKVVLTPPYGIVSVCMKWEYSEWQI